MTPDELLKQVADAERNERARRGIPPNHVLDISEFPFVFARPVFERFTKAVFQWSEKTVEPNTLAMRAFAHVLLGEYQAADDALEKFHALEPNDPIGAMRFTRIQSLFPAAIPPAQGDWPKQPAFFIACDSDYFARYSVPFLRSLAKHAPGSAVHIHFIGPVPRHDPLDLQLTTTFEPAPTSISLREYCGAIRLVRFAQAVAESNQSIVMTDTDAIVTADPRFIFDLPGDTALRIRAGRIEPWNHFSACFVRGTVASKTYLSAVARIIAGSLGNPFWGLDQYALFSAYVQTKPALTLIGPDIASVDAQHPGLFWFTAGTAKQSLHEQDTPYARLYREYA